MNPAISVILFTTLIGAGQGLFVALVAAEALLPLRPLPTVSGAFFAFGSLLALLLLGLGLLASCFHLGRPERGWRAASMWRTSWLSREIILLPLTMSLVAGYGLVHHLADGNASLTLGVIGVLASIVLFICTGMIYACIRFLQEWASPLTVINHTLLGCASGFTLAAGYAAWTAPSLVELLASCAIAVTLAAFATRSASLSRNARLRQKSTLQSAIGVRHPQIIQNAQGFMGGSFNTREFFHGRSAAYLRSVKWVFLVLTFPVPLLLLSVGLINNLPLALAAAFVTQYVGLLAERWFFFAQANHPQNLYYQTVG
ncbi:MAG: dimethyl sulfoxide reductase anchor subunit [Gammaproteobacteria bacterium]|nr:dimethyl sulfoxide reductase anchor subunit [Gammaproteobacteria bacterium]